MGLFAIGLGLEEDHFSKLFGERRMSLVKLIRYPETPQGSFGVHAHRDTGFLTILAAGTTPGLQVQNQAGDWIDVPIIPNSFVVNIGEALQHMTGNYFVATNHRVRTNVPGRLSCGYFHGPSLDTSLQVLKDLPQWCKDAVQTSDHHKDAGFMTQTPIEGESDGESSKHGQRSLVWGELVWNYLERSYPDSMVTHYPQDYSL
jgi:isopenicillin N synthase-like dioxygenase